MNETVRLQGIGMTSKRTRARLIQRLRDAGIGDERVLAAMESVPRHIFVDEALSGRAYEDTALPIGHNQTISQPYTVALMTQTLIKDRPPLAKVLEVGTGSGYQAAVLARLVREVYTVERIMPLYLQARNRLAAMGLRNVRCQRNHSALGWQEHAPYDGILVTAAAAGQLDELLDQLAEGGRLVAPLKSDQGDQHLWCFDKDADGVTKHPLGEANFVPLIRGP